MSLAFMRVAVRGVITGALLSLAAPSGAQDRRQGEPGQFDYYVLALSWSPSFCADSAERDAGRSARNPQCGPRPFSFVVHGLWPQYERGFPEFCQVPAPRLNRNIVSAMLDLMPAPNLIFHEWDRHGTCSGLSPNAYFETIRKARAVVKIPPQYIDLSSALTVTPEEVEEAFIKANPGLKPESIAITCGSRRLDEVRICMTRDLQFRGCDEVARRTCRRDKLIMPPVRGG
ncbi:MAG TPA: ribonuclease T2 [Xanthobacteraceae bacterium]|nr:ribonuclease T2 [Xanthobacteraceae bacterium]